MIDMLLMAPPAGGAAPTGGANGLVTFLPFVLMIVVVYFLMLRPQMKKQKETTKMLTSLEKGDKVVTNGGIIGTIAGFTDNPEILTLRVAEGTKIEILKSAITAKLDA